MIISYNTPLWLYPQPIDFRKQIDGLVLLIADCLQLQPTSGQLFMFRNRKGNQIKLLWWDKDGFWLCYKRLERGRFKYPALSDNVMELTREQLSWLLSGLNFLNYTRIAEVKATHFY